MLHTVLAVRLRKASGSQLFTERGTDQVNTSPIIGGRYKVDEFVGPERRSRITLERDVVGYYSEGGSPTSLCPESSRLKVRRANT